jgi:hypothetical protein
MFTQLKFTYEQELHPEEFFIPYVWKLVVSQRYGSKFILRFYNSSDLPTAEVFLFNEIVICSDCFLH